MFSVLRSTNSYSIQPYETKFEGTCFREASLTMEATQTTCTSSSYTGNWPAGNDEKQEARRGLASWCHHETTGSSLIFDRRGGEDVEKTIRPLQSLVEE